MTGWQRGQIVGRNRYPCGHLTGGCPGMEWNSDHGGERSSMILTLICLVGGLAATIGAVTLEWRQLIADDQAEVIYFLPSSNVA